MTMFPIREPLNLPNRQILAGAGMLLFVGIFFALPLWAAMSLCAMPCCHHSDAAKALAAGSMPCANECSVQAPEAPSTTVVSVQKAPVVTQALGPVSTATIALPHREAPPLAQARAAAEPLHLLNSVFRI